MATTRDITIKITCLINYFLRVRVKYLPSKKDFLAAQYNLNIGGSFFWGGIKDLIFNALVIASVGGERKSPAVTFYSAVQSNN